MPKIYNLVILYTQLSQQFKKTRTVVNRTALSLLILLPASIGFAHELDENEKCSRYYQDDSSRSSTSYSKKQSIFQECWYAGAALGSTYLSPNINSNGWSTNADFSKGLSFFIGREFKEHWGLEYSYAYLGKSKLRNSDPVVDSNIEAEIRHRASSIMVYHRFLEESATFNVYLKGGASLVRTEQTHDSVNYRRENHLRPSLGAGIRFRADNSPWFVRFDLHFPDLDSSYSSVQLGRYFGYKTTLNKSTSIKLTHPENKALKRDTDGDQVIDEFDKCPHSAAGAIVNAVGCCTEEQGCVQIF